MASWDTPAFIAAGRQSAIDRLQANLTDALAGKSQLFLVAGNAGTGKTTLLREFCRQAESSHPKLVIAWGQCSAEHGDPYLPFKEIVSLLTGDIDGVLAPRLIGQTNANRLKSTALVAAEILVEVGGDLVEVLVPGAALVSRVVGLVAKAAKVGWVDRLQKKAAKPKTGGEFIPEQIFEQFSRMLFQLAGRSPLILVLDDLHWADHSTVEMFFYLARRLQETRQTPVMLVGMYRVAEIRLGRDGKRHPMESILNETRRYWGDIEIDLGATVGSPAGQAFIDVLVDSEPNRLGTEFRQLLFKRTGGHAMFTVELLRALEERQAIQKDTTGRWYQAQELSLAELPEKVEAVIEERIGRLEDQLRGILTCGSVEGEQFTAEVIARVRAIQELQLAEKLSEELEKRHHLVLPAGEVRAQRKPLHLYRFPHGIFQQYLYENLSPMLRQQLHLAVGEALEQLYGDRSTEIAAQLAHHFEEAFEEDRAVKYCLIAGHRARARYANADALTYYQKAQTILEETDSPDTRGIRNFTGDCPGVRSTGECNLPNQSDWPVDADCRDDW